jgi:hypothetical protein
VASPESRTEVRATDGLDGDPAATAIREKVSADTAGPMPTLSQGNRFFTVLVDRASKFARSIPTATKGDAGLHIVSTLRALQLASGKILRRYQTDGAKELYLGSVQPFLQQQATTTTVTLPTQLCHDRPGRAHHPDNPHRRTDFPPCLRT